MFQRKKSAFIFRAEDEANKETSNMQAASRAGFLLDLTFESEDAHSTFLENIRLLPEYTWSQSKKQHSSLK